jgi:fimbrial chaperone protein
MKAWIGAMALLFSIGPAVAQNNYTVSPLRLELSAKAPSTVLQVTNRGDAAATMQVQQRVWVQRNGQDEQAETRGLIISPAIFTFKPGETQVVRIALRASPDRQVEGAYRILVSELPAASVATAPEVLSFRIALRMDLPLFVAALEPGSPAPSVELERASGRLVVRNEGRSHIRFTDFTLQQAGRRLHSVPVFTVLPGSFISLELPQGDPAATNAGARAEADSNAGPISLDVVPR